MNGKRHRYWSVVESRRVAGGDPLQRPVLYLGEINDSQEAAWRKTSAVFDEQRQRVEPFALFPADRPLPPAEVNGLSVVLTALRLQRPRSFGDCWLGGWLWEELGLSDFWNARLSAARGDVPWAKVLQLLVVNRLCEPGREFAVHRRWFDRSAMDELLGTDFAVAAKDRLYRCLDRLLPHKDDLCRHLTARWKTLFDASFDVLRYDLTSTYFEGLCAEIPKAKHGYSRDGRPDCRQVVIALVVTTDGLPLAYEVLALDRTQVCQGHAAAAVAEAGKGLGRAAVGAGTRRCAGEAAGAGPGSVCIGPQCRPPAEGSGDSPAPAQEACAWAQPAQAASGHA
jgi:hypothetical protein